MIACPIFKVNWRIGGVTFWVSGVDDNLGQLYWSVSEEDAINMGETQLKSVISGRNMNERMPVIVESKKYSGDIESHEYTNV